MQRLLFEMGEDGELVFMEYEAVKEKKEKKLGDV
jgi:hypothetical protein